MHMQLTKNSYFWQNIANYYIELKKKKKKIGFFLNVLE